MHMGAIASCPLGRAGCRAAREEDERRVVTIEDVVSWYFTNIDTIRRIAEEIEIMNHPLPAHIYPQGRRRWPIPPKWL